MKKLVIGLLLLIFCSTVASATMTVTDNYPGWTNTATPPAVVLSPWKTIDRGVWLQHPVINFTVTGATGGAYKYIVMLSQTFNDSSFEHNATVSTSSGAMATGTGVGNHTYQVTLDTREFLYDNVSYLLSVVIYRSGTLLASNTSCLNMTGGGATGTYVHFSQADPPYLDLHGWRAVGRGMTFKTTGYHFNSGWTTWYWTTWYTPGALDATPVTVTILVTDNTSSHSLICHNQYTITYQPDPSRDASLVYGAVTDVFHWGVLPMLTSGEGKAYFHARTSYYVFVGVNQSASNHVTTDDTFLLTDFSIDNFNAGTSVHPDLSKTHKYNGVYTYFETFPTGTGAGWTPGTAPSSPIGVLIINYCAAAPPAGLGMPWFAVVLAFLPAIILVCALYSASLRYHASLPNFLYAFAAVAGLTISYGISLLVLWEFVFMLLLMAGVTLYGYREQISTIVSAEGGLHGLSPLIRPGTEWTMERHRRHAGLKREEGVRKTRTAAVLHEVGYHWQRNPSGKRVLVRTAENPRRRSEVLVTTKTSNGRVQMETHTVNGEKRRRASQ